MSPVLPTPSTNASLSLLGDTLASESVFLLGRSSGNGAVCNSTPKSYIYRIAIPLRMLRETELRTLAELRELATVAFSLRLA